MQGQWRKKLLNQQFCTLLTLVKGHHEEKTLHNAYTTHTPRDQSQTREPLLMSSEVNLGRLEGEWFSEVNEDWPGNAFSLKIKKVLCHEKSKFQDILIFER